MPAAQSFEDAQMVYDIAKVLQSIQLSMAYLESGVSRFVSEAMLAAVAANEKRERKGKQPLRLVTDDDAKP